MDTALELVGTGSNNHVIRLNSNRVAKVFQGYEEQYWAEKEYTYLCIAHSIVPGLYPMCISIEEVGVQTRHVVMERLHPVEPHTLSKREKETAICVMYEQWYLLHKYLASWDIARVSGSGGTKWDNVMVCHTRDGPRIRFVDMGNAKLVGHRLFKRAKSDDLLAIEEYVCLLLIDNLY